MRGRGRYYLQTSVGLDGRVRSEIKRYRPRSGAERMRELRARQPGYDVAYKAKHRAEVQALVAKLEAEKAALVEKMIARQRTVLMLPAPAVRLCLPAPVVDPTMEAIKALAMKRVRESIAA
jgi:hypothetical protein